MQICGCINSLNDSQLQSRKKWILYYLFYNKKWHGTFLHIYLNMFLKVIGFKLFPKWLVYQQSLTIHTVLWNVTHLFHIFTSCINTLGFALFNQKHFFNKYLKKPMKYLVCGEYKQEYNSLVSTVLARLKPFQCTCISWNLNVSLCATILFLGKYIC